MPYRLQPHLQAASCRVARATFAALGTSHNSYALGSTFRGHCEASGLCPSGFYRPWHQPTQLDKDLKVKGMWHALEVLQHRMPWDLFEQGRRKHHHSPKCLHLKWPREMTCSKQTPSLGHVCRHVAPSNVAAETSAFSSSLPDTSCFWKQSQKIALNKTNTTENIHQKKHETLEKTGGYLSLLCRLRRLFLPAILFLFLSISADTSGAKRGKRRSRANIETMVFPLGVAQLFKSQELDRSLCFHLPGQPFWVSIFEPHPF